MSEKPKNMKEITIQQLAPIAGRLVALYAAADVEFAATKIAADGTAQGAKLAEAKLDKGDEYLFEATKLHIQAREIAFKNGDSLPGIEGLKAIAATAHSSA